MPLPKRILVPVDFSDTSRAAAEQAIEMVKASDGHLLVLHVLDARYTSMLVGYGLQVAPMTPPDLDKIANESLEKFLSDLPLEGVSYERLMRVGLPADEILSATTENRADLICMGTHGRTGVRRMIIGSEAERVIRQSPVPVLVMRSPDSD